MTDEAGLEIPSLQVDGGASANDLLCQLQADQLGVPVQRPQVRGDHRARRGVPGRARHRGVGAGRRPGAWRLDRQFEPAAGVRDDGSHARWLRAVERARGWEG